MRARLIALLVTCALAAVASAQERFGGITGSVTDTTKAAVPGATVTLTNKTTNAVRTTVTGSDGVYRVPDLEPGRYSVAIELQGFQRASNDDVQVLLGRTVTFDAELRPGALTETVNVTADAAKQVDLSSVTLSHNVTAEEFDRLPKARSFQGIALTAPGVNSGDVEGGFQVNGASGAENSFTVDGVATNSLIYGSSRQNTVFEYLQEVQIKTGGIDAEYGGALGGVISAVTKSGGNRFTGEAHYYYLGSPLSAGPVKRLVLDPNTLASSAYYQDTKQPNNQNEFGGSLGGPIVKNRLFFFGSISPRVLRRENAYLFNSGTQPDTLNQDQTQWQGFGKLTYASTKVQANGSLLMTPTRSTGRLPAYDAQGANFVTTSLASAQPNKVRGFEIDQNTAAGNVDVWLGRNSYISARGGYFYDSYKDTGIPNTTSYTYQQPSSASPIPLPVSLQGPTGTSNTPRAQIANFDTTKQGYFQLDYNHAFNAAGSHLLKGGWGIRRNENNVNTAYPGGYVYIYWGQSFQSQATGQVGTGTYGYYRVDDVATRGDVHANIQTLYVQDTWAVGPRVTLNLGVRSENEKIPTFRPDIAQYAFNFGFGDKIAPRLGVSYDVRGDGRMKAFASWGRYYDWTRYELVRGSFGGDIWHIFYRSLDALDLGSINLNNLPGRDLWGSSTGFRDFRGTSIQNTDPNTKPMFQDSFNAGVDYQLGARQMVGVHYIHNNLTRTIEDMGALVNGDVLYVIGNPGEGANTITPTSGLTAPFATPKPKRQYDALEVTWERRFANNWFASANYTLSRLYGNYAGTANSDEISTPTTGVTSATAQQQGGSIARPGSNSSTAWDIDEILWDAHGNLDPRGRLATDRPNVVKLYGGYQFKFGTQLGLFFYGGSGTPVSTQVITENAYAPFVNGRGDMGRTPVLTRTDLLIAHELSLTQQKRVRLELNIQNLFNQKTATHIFNFLNKGAPSGGSFIAANAIDLSHVDLAKGYDYNALILQTQQGAFSYDPRYGQADLFQPGLQGYFDVKFLF